MKKWRVIRAPLLPDIEIESLWVDVTRSGALVFYGRIFDQPPTPDAYRYSKTYSYSPDHARQYDIIRIVGLPWYGVEAMEEKPV